MKREMIRVLCPERGVLKQLHEYPGAVSKLSMSTQRQWVSYQWESLPSLFLTLNVFLPNSLQPFFHLEVLTTTIIVHKPATLFFPLTQCRLQSWRLCRLNISHIQPLLPVSSTTALIQVLILTPFNTFSPVLNSTWEWSSHSHPKTHQNPLP